MKIITSIFDLNKEIKDYKNLGFVPTMGGIHPGHISLINLASEVPPVVERTGFFPVTFFTDLTKVFTNSSGFV